MTTASDQALVREHNDRERGNDWRVLKVDGLYVLEYRDPALWRWHEMFKAATWDECDAAFDAYQNGEQPEAGEWWP